jgi:amidase
MDTYHRWMEVVVPASLAGLPALALPAGFGAGGLPAGVQLIGAAGSDAMLMALGQAYHEATDWPGSRPPPGAV